jgi:hypothetical protein
MREIYMAQPNLLPLRPGLSIVYNEIIFFFNVTYSVRYFRVPPAVLVPQVEDLWSRL